MNLRLDIMQNFEHTSLETALPQTQRTLHITIGDTTRHKLCLTNFGDTFLPSCLVIVYVLCTYRQLLSRVVENSQHLKRRNFISFLVYFSNVCCLFMFIKYTNKQNAAKKAMLWSTKSQMERKNEP